MLATIADVISFYETKRRAFPEIADAFLSQRDVKKVGHFDELGLSQELTEFLESYRFEGVSVGPLNFSRLPSDASESEGTTTEVEQGTKYRQLGSIEGDPVLGAIGNEMHDKTGIFLLDISSGFDRPATELAPTTEALVIGMGNLHQIVEQHDDDTRIAFLNMIKAMIPNCSSAQVDVWERVAVGYI